MSNLMGRTGALLVGRLLALLCELGVAALLPRDAVEAAPWIGRLLELVLDVAAMSLCGWLRERTVEREAPGCACRYRPDPCRATWAPAPCVRTGCARPAPDAIRGECGAPIVRGRAFPGAAEEKT